jgi:hypothetical protein
MANFIDQQIYLIIFETSYCNEQIYFVDNGIWLFYSWMCSYSYNLMKIY